MRVTVAGIVLCGGASARMGRPKCDLPFGAEPMLVRVVRRLSAAVGPIVVVAARDQSLPRLPAAIRVARDRRDGRGPLEGLSAGLAALPAHAGAAYVTGCDAPLLVPEFVRRLVGWLDDFDAVVPTDGDLLHPLSAVYRRRVAAEVDQLLAENRRRVDGLFDRVRTRRVPVEQLRDVDPELASLANLNRPADYVAALAREDLPVPCELRGEPATLTGGNGSPMPSGPKE